MGFRFREFTVYQEARVLVKDLYFLSRKFPSVELNGLTSQLRRASTSIMLNLAEGSGKKSDKELNRFILIAIGSVHEIVAILDISLDLGYITISLHKSFEERCETLVKKLYGFSKRLSVKR